MNHREDNLWPFMLGMAVLFIAMGIHFSIRDAAVESTKQEAIKAGLIQIDGEWVPRDQQLSSE